MSRAPGAIVAPVFDLAVIGGGIVGTMVAWQALERFPDWRILLVERRDVGGGATRLSVGLDLPYGHNAWRRDLTAESLGLYEQLLRRLPGLPIERLPLVCVAARDRVEEHLARFVGPPPHLAGPGELEELRTAWPWLRLDDRQAVLTGAVCRRARPAGIAQTLAADLRRRGIEIWEGTGAHGLTSDAGEVRLTTQDGRAARAHGVVLATGPWTLPGPAGEAMRRREIRIKKVAALHLDVRPAPAAPVVYFLDDDAFLMPLPDREQVLFSFRCEVWDCDPQGDLALLEEDRRQGLDCLSRLAPALIGAARGGRAFCDAYGPDRSPVVAPVPEIPGSVLAAAGSGSGYRLAPAMARRALDALPAAAGRLIPVGEESEQTC